MSTPPADIRFESVEFVDLCFERKKGFAVLDHIHFEFPLNGFVQVQGKRGAGVSSLLQIMAGILTPTFGHYYVNGLDVADMTQQQFRPFQIKIGYGFDQGGLLSNTTLLENLLLPMLYHRKLPPEAARSRAVEYLQRFDILEFKAIWPALASHGTRKACLLARAFLLHPELLILDEPTLGLDRDGIHRLVATIKMHQQNYGLRHVIVGSRDEYFLDFFKDRQVVELQDGKLTLTAKAA